MILLSNVILKHYIINVILNKLFNNTNSSTHGGLSGCARGPVIDVYIYSM